jgi:hypothetical protein
MRLIVLRPRALLASLVGVLAISALTVAPVAAIRYGDNDGNAHPYVGLMVAQDSAGNPLWRCTGTLLSSRVLLTAGHCVEEPAAHVEVFFAAGPIPLGAGYPAAGSKPCKGVTGYPCTGDIGGTPHQNPDWDPDAFYLHDVGIVEFNRAYRGTSTFGQVPSEDQLDSLHAGHHTTFTAVGYGRQLSFPDAAAWKVQANRVRMVAYPWLYQINTNYTGPRILVLSDNASSGGTCFGDSGGPNFLGSSRVVAAVTSFGINDVCAGLGGAYRIDRQRDRDWILSFL